MKEAVFEHFKPVYMSVNETDIIAKNFTVVNRPEVEHFLHPIANLSDKNIRKKYNQCKRDHPNLRFENYNPNVVGGVVMDDNEIISISFSVPSIDGNLISVINKYLKGYTELGVFTYVEWSKFLCDKGFSRVYIGSVNNDFKKKFLQNSFSHDIYSYEIYKIPNFKSSEWHLLNLFS